MPAYRERVYLCPRENGQPGWVLDFPLWWNRAEFFQKFGNRQIDTGNPIDLNYALLLTAWEATAWDEYSRAQFAQDPRSKTPFMVQAMREWESKLRAANWVIVESYEWESGLD